MRGLLEAARQRRKARVAFPKGRKRRVRPSGGEQQCDPERHHQQRSEELDPRAASAMRESSPRASRMATRLAKTAAKASAPVVRATPNDIATTAPIPAKNNPCDSAKTRTRIAPEHGREPAAATVAAAPRQEKPASRVVGSGACRWPQAARSSAAAFAAPPGGPARKAAAAPRSAVGATARRRRPARRRARRGAPAASSAPRAARDPW